MLESLNSACLQIAQALPSLFSVSRTHSSFSNRDLDILRRSATGARAYITANLESLLLVLASVLDSVLAMAWCLWVRWQQ